ncbi:MAG TPA: CrcB family protein [Burkholderiaceae bacterium]|nr:CrcB family protein [Burkholderiaceae bacterium]
MLTIGHALAVSIGAALGALCRWLIGLSLNSGGAGWPWGTLLVNAVGGYLIGLLLGVFATQPEVPMWLRLFALTGFLGGMTTFSAFSGETVAMLMRGAYVSAGGYVAASVLGSLAATGLGFYTASRWV